MALVTAPDGTPGEVPDSQLEEAVRQGYVPRQATAEEAARAEAGEANLQTGAEALVRTAIPVLGQELVTSFEEGQSGQSREEVLAGQKLRKEENPLANVVGTGAGFAFGPGKLLKRPLAALRAGGLASTFTAGAVEGGLFGLEEAVNESMVDQTPLTAEKLAASAISAALVGGSLDTALGGVTRGISAVLKKAAAPEIKATLSKAGDKASRSMIDSASWARKFGTYEDDVLRVAREEGVLTPGLALTREGLDNVSSATERVSQRVADYLETAQTLQKPQPAAILQNVKRNLKADFGRDPMARASLQQVSDALDDMAAQGSTWSEWWNLQRNWRNMAEGSTTLRGDVLDKARLHLRNYIAEAAPKQVPGLGDTLKRLNERVAAMSAFQSGFEDALTKFEARGLFGAKEMAAGVMAAQYGGLPGLGLAAVSGAAAHTLRKRGGFALGETLSRFARSDTLERLAKSFEKNVTMRLATAPELLGPFRTALQQAASQGAMDLLETHVALMESEQGRDYAARMGIEPSDEMLPAIGQRIAAYDSINNTVDEYDKSLAGAVDGLFGAAPGRKGGFESTISPKEFSATMENVHRLMADPESLFMQVPAELNNAAPGSMGAMTANILRAAQFLDSKAPKNPYYGMPPSVAPHWEPDAVSLDRFNRYKEAVESPARALKNMANGYLSTEQQEALQVVYPALYADLQQKIGERLATWNKPLSYQQKLALTMVVGPGALGMTPQQVQILQQSQAMSTMATTSSGSATNDGRQDVNQEDNLETQSQRLEAR